MFVNKKIILDYAEKGDTIEFLIIQGTGDGGQTRVVAVQGWAQGLYWKLDLQDLVTGWI